jgi:hypothetical protein
MVGDPSEQRVAVVALDHVIGRRFWAFEPERAPREGALGSPGAVALSDDFVFAVDLGGRLVTLRR